MKYLLFLAALCYADPIVFGLYAYRDNAAYYMDSEGVSETDSIDQYGRTFRSEYESGMVAWTDYDSLGRVLIRYSNTGLYSYYEYRNDTAIVSSNYGTEWFEGGQYPAHGVSDEVEWWREYDEFGNEIYYKDARGEEVFTINAYLNGKLASVIIIATN